MRPMMPVLFPGFQDMPDYRNRLAQGLRDAGLPEE